MQKEKVDYGAILTYDSKLWKKWYMYELSGTVLSTLQISTNSNSNGMSGGIIPITNEFYDLMIQ